MKISGSKLRASVHCTPILIFHTLSGRLCMYLVIFIASYAVNKMRYAVIVFFILIV